MTIQSAVAGVLLVLGIGFLVVNARLLIEYLRYVRRRRNALLTWRGPRPPYYVMALGIGVVLGVLVMINLYFRRPLFGVFMMFLYYGYLSPLSQTIGRGFYEDGIWADTAFIPYNEVGGVSWREGEHEVTLIVISRLRNLARRLVVPGDKYGAARRLLREKIGNNEIHFSGTGLNLGQRDERDEV